MVKADTPAPEEKEEKATPPEGADTPAEEPEGEPTTPTPQEEKVAKLEGQVEDLTNKLARQEKIAQTAQRQQKVADIEKKKVEETLEKIRSGEISPDEQIPEGESSTERETRLEARIKIQGLIIDNPEYQELMREDVTLKEVLKNNPFALIGDYLDAQDAVDQLKDKLDERVSTLRAKKKASQPEKEPGKEEGGEGEGEGEGKEFEVGPVQPGERKEAPPKEPSHQTPMDSVEESIKGKIKIGP